MLGVSPWAIHGLDLMIVRASTGTYFGTLRGVGASVMGEAIICELDRLV